jgi:hypothetical protein
MTSLIEQQKQRNKRAKIIMELYRHWVGFFKAIIKILYDYDIDTQRYKDN